MPTIQLPLALPIDTTRRETWQWWNKRPPRQEQWDREEFWDHMTALTIPQELSLRLGRTPDLVSILTTSGIYKDRDHRLHEGVWRRVSLTRYEGIWSRTHRARVFRVVPGGGKGRLASDNPLRPIIAWAEPEDVIEDRFVMAGYDQGWGYRRRRDAVKTIIRDATRHGYLADLGVIAVPHKVWMPHARECTKLGIRQPRIRDVALDHGALAVEAGLMRQGFRDSVSAIRSINSEADLSSAMRAKLGRAVAAGDQFDALPDLEIVTRGGMRYYTEVLAESYRNAQLAAKYGAIERAVDYVATSRTVANRVVRVNVNSTCYHF